MVNNSNDTRKILDSGVREEFSTGSVRDTQEGKGRMDLLPLCDLVEVFNNEYVKSILLYLHSFECIVDVRILHDVLRKFSACHSHSVSVRNPMYIDTQDSDQSRDEQQIQADCADMILEVGKHYEEGAKKYSERNWEKGQPVSRYLSSAIRHFLKYVAGYEDEPHDRAFVWNILAIMYTMRVHPELIDIKAGDVK